MNIKQINTYIEKHKDLILEAERYIWNHPETGYKEYKTTAYMKECFEQLGYSLVMADGITGFYTRIETGRPGPEILILGELDSVLCPTHEEADPIQVRCIHAVTTRNVRHCLASQRRSKSLMRWMRFRATFDFVRFLQRSFWKLNTDRSL